MRLIVATQPLPHDLAQMLDERRVRRECRRAMRYDSPSRDVATRHGGNALSAAKPLPTTPKTQMARSQCGADKRACGQHTKLGERVDSERLYPTTH